MLEWRIAACAVRGATPPLLNSDLNPVNSSSDCERIHPGEARRGLIQMSQKRYGVDQIIPMLRRADVELGKGKKVPEICKLLGVATRRITAGARSMVVWPRKWPRN